MSDCWLTTERLALRRFTPDDLDWFADLYGDAEVMRHVGGPKSRAQAEEVMRTRILEYYAANPGLGIWMTVDKSSGDQLGMHILNNIQGESFIQVGFILSKAAWGRGVGTEMARALVGYGFTTLALPRIVAITDLDNYASQHVLLKAGLRRNGERAFPHPAYAAAGPMAWFERDAADWISQSR